MTQIEWINPDLSFQIGCYPFHQRHPRLSCANHLELAN